MAGPYAPVTAPQPQPPAVGILQSANPVDDPGRWQLGLTYEPELCDGVGGIGTCGDTGAWAPAENREVVTYSPFVLYAVRKCSTLGRADSTAKARALLERGLSKAIEAEMLTGDISDAMGWSNMHLASDAASDDLSEGIASADPLGGLACLEQYLGDCGFGGVGMIHAPRGVVTLWSNLAVVKRDPGDGKLRTINGNIVVSGAGYDGRGPSGQARSAGSVWAYATGIVDLRLGPVEDIGGRNAQGVIRSVNDEFAIAYRYVAAVWPPCCQGAVQLDVDLCEIGGS